MELLASVKASNYSFVGYIIDQTSNLKRCNNDRALMKAAVKLHSHRNPLMPAGWINANESCHDGWCNIVMDNGITVTVTLEYLKRQSKKI